MGLLFSTRRNNNLLHNSLPSQPIDSSPVTSELSAPPPPPPSSSYPPPPPPYADHGYRVCRTIKYNVVVHKDTIKLEVDETSPDCHLVSFIFDVLGDGSITVFYFAKEGADCSFSPLYPEAYMPVRIPVQNGLRQKFRQSPGTGINLRLLELDDLSEPSPDKDVFPLVILAESCLPARSVDDQLAGVDYNVRGAKCVICMAEPIDTAVLPCRHMLMCSECGDENKLLHIEVKIGGGVDMKQDHLNIPADKDELKVIQALLKTCHNWRNQSNSATGCFWVGIEYHYLLLCKRRGRLQLEPLYPETYMPVRAPIQNGLCQKFYQSPGTGINLRLFELDDLSKPSPDEDIFPLVILAESCLPAQSVDDQLGQSLPPTPSIHAQITQAIFEKNSRDDSFRAKVVKQILWSNDRVRYELNDFYALGNPFTAGIDNNDRRMNCVICMAEPIDTVVLPCRRLLRFIKSISVLSFAGFKITFR
ncbi:hypothetical protein NE237_015240 [Protea cynaroides]|uniref:RING-type E3 ubiquitin transferase n=1 Tax=Protea cynaroides TaxID=273540 RepID=A0A9Q0KDP2_9MAGN|nr:hypothetical protein NE237_015240 [Protea cynaroides]